MLDYARRYKFWLELNPYEISAMLFHFFGYISPFYVNQVLPIDNRLTSPATTTFVREHQFETMLIPTKHIAIRVALFLVPEFEVCPSWKDGPP